jgi:CSLREA domain-containing protein
MVQKGRSRVRLALLVVLWALPSGPALADTFQVTKTLDTRDGKCDAHCSLREAIIAANQHPGPDIVMLPAGHYVLQRVGQEDQAAAGDLDIHDDLTLIGAGAKSTLIDGNQDRVFRIHSPAIVLLSGLTVRKGGNVNGGGISNSGTLTLTNCTLSGNSAAVGVGGGIYNETGGTLTLTNCTLSGNSAEGSNSATDGNGGGIFNSGKATLTNCTLSGNSTEGAGGGIYNATGGTLTLTNCTLSGNSTRYGDANGGGGIYNETGGTLTLTNCTLSGNSARDGAGGGIDNSGKATLTSCKLSGNSTRDGYGGGGISNGGTLTLTNCTLSANSTLSFDGNDGGGIGGGGISNSGTSTLTNCTLSANSAAIGVGGGIYNETSGTLTLTNCTLSGNSARDGGDGIGNSGKAILENTILANSSRGRNCSAPLQSNGHNLDDGDGGCGFSNTGDLSVVPANLAPLGNYGGPTQTHAICTGFWMPHPDCTAASPAVDAGANAHCPATDQRGAPRPQGSACDIGAYESGAPMPGSCHGDCGNDGAVTVNEIITMVNIALGTANVSSCIAGDADGSGDITINEIIAAVNNALTACPAS